MSGDNTDEIPSAAALLAVQIRQAWTTSRVVFDGLDEDEYHWAPTDNTWDVRRRADAGRAWGAGEWVCEDAFPQPQPVPVPTIAWRVVHLAAWTEVYLDWTFGDAKLGLNDIEIVGDSDGAVRWLFGVQDRFMANVDALRPEDAFEMRPAHWGQRLPVARLVTIMLTEHVHHIAEIGALRDIRRGAARTQPMPPTIAAPSWWSPTPG